MYKTHGMWRTPTYLIWQGMINRCLHDKRYIALGVCDRWRKFENFYSDMGERPEGMTIERINNEEGYSPDNCRWATHIEQQANKCNNRLITHDGVTLHLSEWARRTGTHKNTIHTRLSRGWGIEEALYGRTKVQAKA